MSVKLSGYWKGQGIASRFYDFVLYEPVRTGQALINEQWQQVDIVGITGDAYLIHWWRKDKKGTPYGKANEIAIAKERVVPD